LSLGEAQESQGVRDVSLLYGRFRAAFLPSRRAAISRRPRDARFGNTGSRSFPRLERVAEHVFGEFSRRRQLPRSASPPKDALSASAKETYALSLEEIEHQRLKSEEKLLEGNRRSSFIAALRAAIKSKGDLVLESKPEFARYLSELESFAQGTGERCPIAAEAGIAEIRESVHQALLDSGIWEKSRNPWPARAGCVLWPPRLEFPDVELPALVTRRSDLRGMVSYAIDNAWSHDPDDAIAIDGDFIWVHIADPAAFIAPDSPLDLEALSRGATLYLPEKIVPMLPEGAVSRLGLGLAPESPALSFGMRLSADGSIVETRIQSSLVQVARLSYEEADIALAAGDATLAALDAAALLRHRKRLSNGAVDIDFPEVSMKADEAPCDLSQSRPPAPRKSFGK